MAAKRLDNPHNVESISTEVTAKQPGIDYETLKNSTVTVNLFRSDSKWGQEEDLKTAKKDLVGTLAIGTAAFAGAAGIFYMGIEAVKPAAELAFGFSAGIAALFGTVMLSWASLAHTRIKRLKESLKTVQN